MNTLHFHRPLPKRHFSETGRLDGWINVCQNDSCRKEFYSKRQDALFCSSACRQTYHRDKNRALKQLRIALLDAQEAARRFSDSQEVYDQAIVLFKGLELALEAFNPVWVQKSFAPPTERFSHTSDQHSKRKANK